MAVYRTIHLSFWTDSKVDDEFTPEDKYFYLYLLTNPHTNICGCYEIGERQFCRETGYNSDTISRLINRFQDVHDVIRYDSATKEVLVLNWYKYNWTKSEDLLKNVKTVASHIKSDEFREYILSLIDDPVDTLPTPCPHPVGTSVTVSVNNTVPVNSKKGIVKGEKKSFVPPTLEEIEEYCKQRNSTVDPKQFYDYFTEGDWVDAKGQKVRNWKQKLITWEKGGYGNAGTSSRARSTEVDKKRNELHEKYKDRDFYSK